MISIHQDDFSAKVLAFKNEPITKNGKALGHSFAVMVNALIEYGHFSKFNFSDEDKRELIFRCFESVPRFNPEKGKAFNYFTTTILCHLRSMFRMQKVADLREEKYGDYIPERTPE